MRVYRPKAQLGREMRAKASIIIYSDGATLDVRKVKVTCQDRENLIVPASPLGARNEP